MVMLIDHIDEIARKKQRDVLFVTFGDNWFSLYKKHFTWENHEVRQHLIEWFEENDITAIPCGTFSNDGIIFGYFGQLYIDVPFDLNDPIYQKLAEFLENPDGTSKFPDVRFCYFTLEEAMKISKHNITNF